MPPCHSPLQPAECPCVPPLPAVTRVRPASEVLPDPLTVINYVAMSMPLLSPFIPIYKVWQCRMCVRVLAVWVGGWVGGWRRAWRFPFSHTRTPAHT